LTDKGCSVSPYMIVEVLCDSNNQEIYGNDTWVKLKGKIKTETVNYEVEPIIVVEHIEKDPTPKTAYLYPF